MQDSLSRLQKQLGHQFHDISLLERALSHRSVGARNNERLEFLGDSLLNMLIADSLFQRFPKSREGQLSQMRAELVKGKTLAEIARGFELGEWLALGPGEMKSGGHRRESILADAVEAIIGAVYLDAGMDVCRDRVLSWYQARLEGISPAAANKDAKSRLQELLQGKGRALPNYRLVATTGSEHAQRFRVECEVEHLTQTFPGEGSSRRAAEQAAAKSALEFLSSQ